MPDGPPLCFLSILQLFSLATLRKKWWNPLPGNCEGIANATKKLRLPDHRIGFVRSQFGGQYALIHYRCRRFSQISEIFTNSIFLFWPFPPEFYRCLQLQKVKNFIFLIPVHVQVWGRSWWIWKNRNFMLNRKMLS